MYRISSQIQAQLKKYYFVIFCGPITGTVFLQFYLTDRSPMVFLFLKKNICSLFFEQYAWEVIVLSETFDLGFLGLNGAIDAEVAQALLSGKNDITKIPA